MKKKYSLFKENMLKLSSQEIIPNTFLSYSIYLIGLVFQFLNGKSYRTEEDFFCVTDYTFSLGNFLNLNHMESK